MPVMMFAVFMMALLCIMFMTVHMGGFVVSMMIEIGRASCRERV